MAIPLRHGRGCATWMCSQCPELYRLHRRNQVDDDLLGEILHEQDIKEARPNHGWGEGGAAAALRPRRPAQLARTKSRMRSAASTHSASGATRAMRTRLAPGLRPSTLRDR